MFDRLPFVHIVSAYHFREIIRTGVIKGTRTDSLNEEVVNIFYGKPAYRPGARKGAQLGFELPVAIILKNSILAPLSRFYPFDTGALSTGRFKKFASDDAIRPIEARVAGPILLKEAAVAIILPETFGPLVDIGVHVSFYPVADSNTPELLESLFFATTKRVLDQFGHASTLWLPQVEPKPDWAASSPSALLLAAELIRNGRLLTELGWLQFEELIARLLESDGWKVVHTQGSKDGGIDVIASRDDPILGRIQSLWQAKKYSEKKKVRLAEVRELSGILAKAASTKAVIVTTSHLTRGALEWIRQDTFRLSFKDKEQLEAWIKRSI